MRVLDNGEGLGLPRGVGINTSLSTRLNKILNLPTDATFIEHLLNV